MADAMSHKPTNTDGRTRDEPYRMNSGKYPGLTIQELSPAYRRYLIREKIYDNYPDLKAALITGGFLPPTQSAAPEPASPTRKRKAMEQTVPSSSQFFKKPALSAEPRNEDITEHSEPVSPARKGKTPEQTAPSSSQHPTLPASSAGLVHEHATSHLGKPQVEDLYIFDFGKHAGKRLREVPSRYISWLINEEVYTNRPALATALRALGRLDAAPWPSLRDSTWKAPHFSEAQEQCFFDPYLDAPLWISDQDSARYFNLRGPTLASAGVYLVSSEELESYSEFGSMFVKCGGHRRWLYPVFACAEHFNTAIPRTARQALQKFLDKNKKRETEMMDELGFGL